MARTAARGAQPPVLACEDDDGLDEASNRVVELAFMEENGDNQDPEVIDRMREKAESMEQNPRGRPGPVITDPERGPGELPSDSVLTLTATVGAGIAPVLPANRHTVTQPDFPHGCLVTVTV